MGKFVSFLGDNSVAAIIAGLFGLVGCLGGLIVAYIGIYQNTEPIKLIIEATQTAEAKLTAQLAERPTFTPELSPSDTTTPTSMPLTNTPIPPTSVSPTDTPIPPAPMPPTDTPIPPTPVPPTNTPIPPTSTPRNDLLPNGEVVSPESLAKLIGGKPEFWTKRGPVVWGYWDEGNNMTFRHPGNNTILTYWAGFPEPRNADGCLIIIPEADNLTRYVKCPSGTQAEFEADGVGFHLIDYTGFFQ